MRWTVGYKISLGYLIAVAWLTAISLLAYSDLSRSLEAGRVADRAIVAVSRLDDLALRIKDAQAGLRAFLQTGDVDELAAYRQASGQIGRALPDVLSMERDDVAPQRLAALQRGIATGLVQMQAAVDTRQRAGQAQLARLSRPAYEDGMRGALSMIDALKVEELARSQSRSAASRQSARLARLAVLFGVPLAAIVAAVAGWLIIRDIARPLQELASVARRAADGDLSLSPDIAPRRDELGALCTAFADMGVSLREKVATAAAISRGELNIRPRLLSTEDELGLAFVAMVENLRGTVANLRSGSLIMSEVASTVSLGAEQVVGAVNETASATLQLATTMDELRQTTALTSRRMESVSGHAEASAEAAQQGKAAVLDASSSMYEVQNRMAVLAERTAQLTEKSLAIGEIVNVVNSLAEQSAILSVNASLEAAHADEHGQGFSMVATEMRNLAGQSKQAVVKVRAILAEVQRLITGLVDAAEQSSLSVTHGVKRSEAAGAALSRMAEIVEANMGTAKDVAAQAVQQAAGITQIASAVHQIKESAGDNLLSMQNIKLATGELERASRMLQGQIAAFKG